PVQGYAATSRLAADYPDAGDEELEYAAMQAAAEDCVGDTAIVIAADLSAAEVEDAGVVAISDALTLSEVASFHVGDTADDLAWYATQELADLIATLPESP